MSEINITQDGKLKKIILKEGSGSNPPNGANVEVHYTGTFQDGRVFDSSKSRNQTFKFPLGAGRVIRGWDLGVASMKKGEKAKFTIHADYAYGARGAGNVIPPNTTLEFEVELINF